ncbi:Signal recognition particle 19 kDa protein [Echinococcus granulosus]|nr:Signal recognition particle 19 kDa protein [Echinococcus granulosus]
MASDLTAPKPFSPLMRHSDKERWICIYPVYLNSRVTRAKGRKVHSRERDPAETQNRWRVRVQLKNDDGSPCMPE